MIYAVLAAGWLWWMVSWQGWQTTRVLRRFRAMRAAHAGWPVPGVSQAGELAKPVEPPDVDGKRVILLPDIRLGASV